MMTRFYVAAVAAALLLALSGPGFAAKRTANTKSAAHAAESRSFTNSSSVVRPYDRDDPYAPGVNWPGRW
jgi:hypothetical protein